MKQRLIAVLVLTAMFVVLVCISADQPPDMGIAAINDMAGIIQNKKPIHKLITTTYKESGVFISVYVDHMVNRDEAVATVRSLAESASFPEKCLFVIYFDTGITYEYFYAPGEEVVKLISKAELKQVFESAASAYEEIGGEKVLYNTLTEVHQLLR